MNPTPNPNDINSAPDDISKNIRIFQLSFYFEDYKHENIPMKNVTEKDYVYIATQSR